MKKVKLIETINKGSHIRKTVIPELVIGDISNGYEKGTILDANAVIELILQLFKDGNVMSSVITSAQILDGSITEDDLSEELMDKINSTRTAVYNADGEIIEFASSNNN